MVMGEVLRKSLKFFWRGQFIFILFSGIFGALFMATSDVSLMASYWAIRYNLDIAVLLAAFLSLVLVSYISHGNFLEKDQIYFRFTHFRIIFSCYFSRKFWIFFSVAFIFLLISIASRYLLTRFGYDGDSITQLISSTVPFEFFILLVFFGTLLPAAVDDDHRFRFKDSLRKSLTVVRAVIGIFVVSFVLRLLWVSIMLLVILYIYPSPSPSANLAHTSDSLRLGPSISDPDFRAWVSLTGIFSVTLMVYLSIFMTIFTSAALSSVYRQIVPAPLPNAE